MLIVNFEIVVGARWYTAAKPDKYFFSPQIEKAKILRKTENKALSCDSCAFVVENPE